MALLSTQHKVIVLQVKTMSMNRYTTKQKYHNPSKGSARGANHDAVKQTLQVVHGSAWIPECAGCQRYDSAHYTCV
jgi:hypothetical protein